jgi:LacI family transcriptional regulator
VKERSDVATIFDVARHAAVSTSTVSHVVNGTRKVSAETARRVQEAIAAVGYTPNGIARALAVSTTNSVGIAVSTITNPYFGDIICAIERECTRLGLMVFLSDTHDDPEHELRVVKAQHLRRVDGIILAPSETGDSETLNYIEANKIPCVLVDRLTSTKFDRVGIQNRHAMGLVVDHLADHGHQRIGFISGQPGFATAIERTEGFRAALSERGLAVDEALIRSGDSIDGAAAAAAELLARPDRPSALAVGNNMSMIGVMRAIRSAGLSVPGDIALVGFDDFEWADCFEPRLTVIAQPVEEIGRKAAELLVRRIAADQSEEPLKPQIIRLKPTLVIRESCGCRA